MDCPITVAERTKMWDLLQDRLPIQICAQLFNEEESVIYGNFFNANLVNRFNYIRNQTDTNFLDILLLTAAQGIMLIFKTVGQTNL